jgi:pyridoxal phosphate enzyme (YggS family)
VSGTEALADRAAGVRAALGRAAERAGRTAEAITIVAVTKTFPPEVVSAALIAGFGHIGENYVQEARAKRQRVNGGVWHLIGGLQRNKVRAAVATFDWVHSVDSLPIAAALGEEAGRVGRRLPVLLQVSPAGEATKRGVPPADVLDLAAAVVRLPGVVLSGLMAIPPDTPDPEASRPHFRLLRNLRDRAQDRIGVELPHLSMGMSNDFMIAVEEGATLLRLGRVLFGPRGARSRREVS